MEPFVQPTPAPASPAPAPAPQNPQLPQGQQPAAEQEEFVQQDWSAPAGPGFYDLGIPYGQERDIESESAFRGILHEEGVPLGVVNTVASIAAKAMAAPPMSTVSSELALRTCRAQLERVWGDDFESNLNAVWAEADRLMKRHPAFVEIFSRPEVGSNPLVVAQILAHAQNRQKA